MIEILLQIVFWLSVGALLHSYVLFPFILYVLSKNKKQNSIVYSRSDNLPDITILMSVYNEELVIENKIKSILNTSYPKERLRVLIGSDASNDNTNKIVERYVKEFPGIVLYPFAERQGKPNVINKLKSYADTEILVLTDAKVFFTEDTLYEMVKHFQNPEIALVGANLLNKHIAHKGISLQENAFMSREIQMKYHEGLIWGLLVGAYGACFAIRKQFLSTVPKNFLVDDFFITMQVIKKGMKAIYELNSICYENVPGVLKEEFRRKVRISTGNFQNLGRFAHMLWPPYKPIAFAFLSHKVIRWLGPILIMLSFASSAILAKQHTFFFVAFVAHVIVLLLPLVDQLFKLLKINIQVLRFITHFLSMNIALFVGLLKYFKGVKSNVWQPTQRNQ